MITYIQPIQLFILLNLNLLVLYAFTILTMNNRYVHYSLLSLGHFDKEFTIMKTFILSEQENKAEKLLISLNQDLLLFHML
jgi:hypothetical protein